SAARPRATTSRRIRDAAAFTALPQFYRTASGRRVNSRSCDCGGISSLRSSPRKRGPRFPIDWIPACAGMNGGETCELGVLALPPGGEGWGGGGKSKSCCMPPPCPSPASGGGESTESAAPSSICCSAGSPAVEQEAVVLELHARDLPRAHGAQQMRKRDGGV